MPSLLYLMQDARDECNSSEYGVLWLIYVASCNQSLPFGAENYPSSSQCQNRSRCTSCRNSAGVTGLRSCVSSNTCICTSPPAMAKLNLFHSTFNFVHLEQDQRELQLKQIALFTDTPLSGKHSTSPCRTCTPYRRSWQRCQSK